MEDIKWHYARSGNRFGPVSWDELKSLANMNELDPGDLVWHRGLLEWVPAGTIQDLFETNQNSDSGSSSSRARPQSQQTVERMRDAASAAIAQGSDHMRLSFSRAIPRVFGNVVSSFGAFAAHPFLISFYSVTFLFAAVLSLYGCVTVIFLPMFVMGYMVIIDQHLRGQPITMAEFIRFMRHGWNSLWHLAMLFASFIITVSLMVAPFLIAGFLLFYLCGTILVIIVGPEGAGYIEPSANTDVSDSSMELLDEAAASGGPVSKLLGSTIFALFGLVGLGMSVLLSVPVYAAVVLFFYLVFDVAGSPPATGGNFDLVYESFGRMLVIGKTRWPELILSGGLLVFLGIGFSTIYVTADVFSVRIFAQGLASWLMAAFFSIGFFVFVVYCNLFVAKTCIELRNDMEQAN